MTPVDSLMLKPVGSPEATNEPPPENTASIGSETASPSELVWSPGLVIGS